MDKIGWETKLMTRPLGFRRMGGISLDWVLHEHSKSGKKYLEEDEIILSL